MKNHSNNLLVLFHQNFITESEVEYLHGILLTTESSEFFCQAHELVNRNRITSNRNKILRESRRRELRPFRFLINKN